MLHRLSTIAMCALAWIAWAQCGSVRATESTTSTHLARFVQKNVDRFVLPPEDGGKAATPSMAVSVGVDGRLVHARGYGDARPGFAATPTTLYSIGSITKQFTAAAMLRLIEEQAASRANGRRVDLDTPLPELFFGVDHWAKDDEPGITIRRLLTMTSNLPNYTRRPPHDLNPWGSIKAPHLLEAIKRLKPFGWPNTFEYSNTSYFLLAQILENLELAGDERSKSYRDRLRANIFQPAGMNDTGFVGDAEVRRLVIAAPLYMFDQPVFTKRDWLKGSADARSNVKDLFAWNKALMEGRIIGSVSRQLMFSEAARVAPSEWYGMGWFVKPGSSNTVYYHSGSVPGFTSINMIMRDNQSGRWTSVSILTNAGRVEGLDALARKIAGEAMKHVR